MNLRAQSNVPEPASTAPVAVTVGSSAPAGTPAQLLSAGTAVPAGRRPNLRPLASLLPYIGRYRGRALAALGALVLAALTTLVLPIAVRRMIDFGFSPRGIELINSYFLVMIGVVAILALASALRYYLVTTLGERIVADLRGDVFAHVTG